LTFAELRRSQLTDLEFDPIASERAGDPAIRDIRARRFLIDLFAYGAASAAALACDYGLLVWLVAWHVHYLLASLVSFSVGMGVAYLLCVRFVFAARRTTSPKAEAAGFVAVGITGLALTQILLYLLVGRLALPVALAKIPTTGIVFLFNFLCRRSLVFVGRRGG
jgi:GtrA-like protein.